MIDIVKLGKEIKRLRKKIGLTQEELAEKLDVRFQAVSNWERGKAPPSIDNLVELSELFGVSVDSIIKPSEEEYYIGVDGDGIKTEFLLFTADGNVRQRVVLPACNPHEVGMMTCKKILMEGIEKIMLNRPIIKAAFIGSTGFGLVSVNDELNTYLRQSTNIKNISIDSDTYNIFALANAEIALISETSIVVIAKPIKKAIAGWGNVFEEYGSEYAIGRDALRACMFYEDGIAEKTSLYRRVVEILFDGKVPHIDSPLRVQTEKIYLLGKKLMMSLVPVVIEEYKNGDKVAIEIIEKNVKHIGLLLNHAMKHTNTNKVIARCRLISNNSEILLPLLKKYTSANLMFSDIPLVFGACRECLRRDSVQEGEKFKENFKKTYELFL